VKTIRDLYTGIYRKPIDETSKKAIDDWKWFQANSNPMDQYLARLYRNASDDAKSGDGSADARPEAVRQRLAKEINWKKPGLSLQDITHEYLIYSQLATETERLLTWGKPVYFDVFTDDKGAILGWINLKEASKKAK
jgi:hypothetical protein